MEGMIYNVSVMHAWVRCYV